jgi:hypothetical protein
MVAVAALVVKPGCAVALLFSLRVVGGTGTLPVSGANHELCGRKLGEVMQKPLPVETYAETALHDQIAVP